ncbi:MAG: molybdopterin molybdotransferase MoeA [Saprospiraceae bacterium]|nr:molybdopterin molybdotransferase MoeA [Saprospiraceae bacterium]
MISVEKASKIIGSHTRSYGQENVPLSQALGRILASDVKADRPFPPYDRVCMDGIAIDHSSYQNGQRTYRIQDVQSAGSARMALESSNLAFEVMTGAILPKGTSTVIRYEDLKWISDDEVEIMIDAKDKANIHYCGEDLERSASLVKRGSVLRSPEIALCATVGASYVPVLKLPRVALISSGDELVDIDEHPEDHQIRKSNIHMLAAELGKLGLEYDSFHLHDVKKEITEQLTGILKEFDIVMMSGGVSKGKFDFIPGVLNDLGVRKHFHKVEQRPGKPFWFGTSDKCIVFAFPGNPVSTLVCYMKYFRPWLKRCLGTDQALRNVRLAEDFEFRPSLTYFAQVRVEETETGGVAHMLKGHGSGDMVNLSRVDGFLELPEGSNVYHSGEYFAFLPFD